MDILETTTVDKSEVASSASHVSLSATAIEHIKKYAAKHDKPAKIRIAVKTSSCSAFAYNFELNGKQEAEDKVLEQDGVTVIIDPKSITFIEGTHIDYRREGIQEGFHFDNPNIKGSCGCGESFTV